MRARRRCSRQSSSGNSSNDSGVCPRCSRRRVHDCRGASRKKRHRPPFSPGSCPAWSGRMHRPAWIEE
jgi:hypothetical protein